MLFIYVWYFDGVFDFSANFHFWKPLLLSVLVIYTYHKRQIINYNALPTVFALFNISSDN